MRAGFVDHYFHSTFEYFTFTVSSFHLIISTEHLTHFYPRIRIKTILIRIQDFGNSDPDPA